MKKYPYFLNHFHYDFFSASSHFHFPIPPCHHLSVKRPPPAASSDSTQKTWSGAHVGEETHRSKPFHGDYDGGHDGDDGDPVILIPCAFDDRDHVHVLKMR